MKEKYKPSDGDLYKTSENTLCKIFQVSMNTETGDEFVTYCVLSANNYSTEEVKKFLKRVDNGTLTLHKRHTPKENEFYKKHDDTFYKILGVAEYNGKELVMFKGIDSNNAVTIIEPVDKFLSPVDKEKYPKAEQEYRFEKC